MKKQILVSLMGVALLGTGVTAYAQVVPNPATIPVGAPTGVLATPPIPVGAPKGALAVPPASTKTEKQVRLEGAVTNMENSLDARIKNLDSLALRIQSRIGKMQQEGKNMTTAVTALSNAQKEIAAAKVDLATLKKRIATMVASKSPRTGFATVKRSATLGVVAKIKLAHKALVDTIVIMKGNGVPAASPMATSSTSTIR